MYIKSMQTKAIHLLRNNKLPRAEKNNGNKGDLFE